MNSKKALIIILAVVCVISLAGNGYLIFAVRKLNQAYHFKQIDERILAFRNMFTEKVLLAEKEVDFETRLALETAVRALNDKEIFDLWTNFTESQTKEEASIRAKNLLRLLVRRTSP